MMSYSTWSNLHHHCSEDLRLRTKWRSFTNYTAITQGIYLHHILLSDAIRQRTTFELSDIATLVWHSRCLAVNVGTPMFYIVPHYCTERNCIVEDVYIIIIIIIITIIPRLIHY